MSCGTLQETLRRSRYEKRTEQIFCTRSEKSSENRSPRFEAKILLITKLQWTNLVRFSGAATTAGGSSCPQFSNCSCAVLQLGGRQGTFARKRRNKWACGVRREVQPAGRTTPRNQPLGPGCGWPGCASEWTNTCTLAISTTRCETPRPCARDCRQHPTVTRHRLSTAVLQARP